MKPNKICLRPAGNSSVDCSELPNCKVTEPPETEQGHIQNCPTLPYPKPNNDREQKLTKPLGNGVKEADVLYISFGKPQPADDSEEVNDVIYRFRENELIGITVPSL